MKRKDFIFRKKIVSLLLLACLPVWLAGCSWFGPRVGVDRITLDVAPKANNDAPIAVDFVAVKDLGLLKQLSGMSARQWFEQREQLQRDYREQLVVWSLELVPGQLLDNQDFPLGGQKAQGLLVFADYASPGPHRLRLYAQSSAWLKFDSRDISLFKGKDG
ncbi:hypothetical protein PMM47T1_16585 [Pseudomonas sp. M47T1]|uniref:hypothetical protein n=1 Tax=Pseudomonas sp. M47T1 TaxID=1179778 RepID=UPI000260885B|nr:hypothetical protein [Pseudomonas sp. M47T1]EIK95424.1 hypothetical protein PMM47T1_16585 [Pseudomonas sp. M47T1]